MPTKDDVVLNEALEEQNKDLPPDRIGFVKGIGGTSANETIPMYICTNRETIFGNNRKVNAQIVLGVDRPSNRFSGHGGKGHSQASSIDIVVGRMGPNPKHVHVDPNFFTDAARIYISQKTDVDKNFNIEAGHVGLSEKKSAIALKSDAIRLIAREGIKLVTGMDRFNSQGGPNKSRTGIDLIAGNYAAGLQPIPRGNNLKVALTRLAEHVNSLNGIVDHMLTTQMNFNESLTHHYHYSPWYGNPTTPSDSVVGKGIKTMIDFLQETKRSLVTNKTNLVNWEKTYLWDNGGKKDAKGNIEDFYINSRWNFSN
jgi:hypothetical protein